jgi:CRP-like cAMP-binding protein
MQTARRISESGVQVALAGIVPERRRGLMLSAAGMQRVLPVARWFADVDNAMEHAETELLALHWPNPTAAAELELAQMDICAGLKREDLEALQPYLRREACPSGTLLFREGEPGDRMFLLAAGAVTLRVDLRKKDQVRRLATFSRGVTIGEMAVLENKTRTADAVCEGDTVLQVLDLAALHRMAIEQPALHGRFLMNLARQTAERLRATTLELRAALE